MNRTKPFSVGAASLLALSALVSGCGGDDDSTAASDGTVRFGAFRTIGNVGVNVTAEEGHFEEAGLKYSPVYSDSVPATLQALISGDLDVVQSVPAVYFGAMANGACVKTLMPLAGTDFNLVAQPDVPVDEEAGYPAVISELKGSVVGVPARGGGPETIMRTFFEDAGLNPDVDVSFVAVGVGPTAVAAFNSGKVEVMFTTTGLEDNLKDFKRVATFASQPDGPLADYMQTTAIVTCEFAESEPELVDKICQALNRGYADLAKDDALGIAAVQRLGIAKDEANAARLWKSYGGALVDRPPMNPKTWDQQGGFSGPGVKTPGYDEAVVAGCSDA